jgi:hypothetical protein
MFAGVFIPACMARRYWVKLFIFIIKELLLLGAIDRPKDLYVGHEFVTEKGKISVVTSKERNDK